MHSIGFWAATTFRHRWSSPMVEVASDGLHPDRPNENRGAESAVSYLLGLAEMRQFARVAGAAAPANLLHNLPLSA